MLGIECKRPALTNPEIMKTRVKKKKEQGHPSLFYLPGIYPGSIVGIDLGREMINGRLGRYFRIHLFHKYLFRAHRLTNNNDLKPFTARVKYMTLLS